MDVKPPAGGPAQSAYNWNPLWQKGTELGTTKNPGGGYHYWGPSPDAGTSYGSWRDDEHDFGVLAPVQADACDLYSPASGQMMRYEGPADANALAAITGFGGDYHLLPASASGHTCLTTAPIYSADVVHCELHNPFTGEDVSQEYTKMKNRKEAARSPVTTPSAPSAAATAASGAGKPSKTGPGMNPQPNSVTPAGAKGEGLPASVKTGEKITPVKPNEKDGKQPSKTNSGGSEGPSEVKTVKTSSMPKVHEVKVPVASAAQQAVESMSDDELIAALEAHMAQAEGDEAVVHIDVDGHDDDDDMDSMPAMSAESSEPELPILTDEPGSSSESPADSAYAGRDPLILGLQATARAMKSGVAVETAGAHRLIRQAMAVLRGTDDKMPAARVAAPATARRDPVLDEVRALARTVAGLTRKIGDMKPSAAVRAAEESAPPAAPVPESAPPAPPASSAPVPEASPAADEAKVDEIVKEAQGVRFEVMQSIDQLERAGITAQSIGMQLYAEGSVNPFWNVVVAGEPIARIYLQDQDRPEDIKALFCSPQYADAIAKATEQIKGGLRQVLTEANARLFALQVDESVVAKRALAAARAEANKTMTDKLTGLSDRFVECMATAAIGMDRNFYNANNPLKQAFCDSLEARGFSTAEAVRVVEEGIAAGSGDYFKALAARANDYMDMEPVAFDQVRKAILEAGTVMPLVDDQVEATAEIDRGVTLASHLAETNMMLQAGDSAGNYPMDPREQLKRDLGFGPGRR